MICILIVSERVENEMGVTRENDIWMIRNLYFFMIHSSGNDIDSSRQIVM